MRHGSERDGDGDATRRDPLRFRADEPPQTLALTVLLACLCAPAAQASPDQASIMMDDDQLLYRNNVTQTRTLVTMRSMGVDAVRATVLWRIVAEGADLTNREIERIKGEKNRDKARAQRARFKPTDPRTYPTRNWDRYDNLVKEADEARHARVLHDHRARARATRTRSRRPPSARTPARTGRTRRAFAASSRRSASATRAPTATRTRSAGCCRACRCGRCGTSPTRPAGCRRSGRRSTASNVPVAPMLYRELHQAGVQGLERSGHGNDADLPRRDRAAGLGQDRPDATACARSRSCARCSASSPTARRTTAPTRRAGAARTS